MFRLFDIFSVAGRKLLLLNGTYDLRKDVLQATWEQIASAFLLIRPRTFTFTQEIGTPSDYQEYTISGVILEGNVVITAPEGYELHPVYNPPYTENIDWERQITITPDADMVIPLCTIRVRLNATELGTYGGKISHVSTNLLTQYIDLSGECEEAPSPPYTAINLGILYNWYITQGTGNSAIISTDMLAEGWHIADKNTDWVTLRNYVDPSSSGWSAGTNNLTSILKDTGTDIYNFNLKPSHGRVFDSGLFMDNTFIITGGASDTPLIIGFSSAYFEQYSSLLLPSIRKTGGCIRLVKAATASELLLADGADAIPYEGIDGKLYKTVKIGTQVWLANNLAETKYQDNSDIVNVTEASAWAALTTGACCYYNNDPSNV